MKGTVAVLGSCLKLLALVDAISLAKVSVSNYNVRWEQGESNWLPEDDPASFLKNSPSFNGYNPSNLLARLAQKNVEHNTRGTSTDYLSYPQTAVDELASPDRKFFSYVGDTPEQNLIPPRNSAVDSQRNTYPYMKLKLNLKIKFPQAGQTEETMVSKPKHVAVVDEELLPFQLPYESPESEPTGSSVDPFVQSFEQINSRAKNLLDPTKGESEKKFERLRHTSRVPNVAQEIATNAKSEDVKTPQLPVQDVIVETKQIDAYLEYLDKVQLLVDKLRALGESEDHPSTKSTEGSQLPELLPEGQIKLLGADLSNDETVPSLEETMVSRPKHITVVDKVSLPSQLSNENPERIVQSFERINTHEKNLADPKESESEKKFELLQHTSRIPQAAQKITTTAKSEDVKIPQLTGPVEDGFTAEATQIDRYLEYLNGLQLVVDKLHALGESQDHSTESKEGISQLPTNLPEGQIKVPDADLSNDEIEPLHEDLLLYDNIYKISKNPSLPFGSSRINSQLSKDQMKLSDSDGIVSEPSKQDLHAKLSDDIHGGSKIPQHGNPPTVSQFSRDIQEDQMEVKLSEPGGLKGHPAEEDPYKKLYDDIYRVPKISNPQIDSQVKLSDPEYFESDNIAKENDPWVKLYETIHEVTKKSPQFFRDLPKTSQLPEDKPKEQMKSSTPDDFESEADEDLVKIHEEEIKPLNTPLEFSTHTFEGQIVQHPEDQETGFTETYQQEVRPFQTDSMKSPEYDDNKETQASKSFLSKLLSWFQ